MAYANNVHSLKKDVCYTDEHQYGYIKDMRLYKKRAEHIILKNGKTSARLFLQNGYDISNAFGGYEYLLKSV